MHAELQKYLPWLTTTIEGMCVLSAVAGILAIVFITLLGAFLKTLIRPNVEHTFYNIILKHWFKGYFLKHKIVATFIKVNNLGEDIVNGIIHLIGMFIAVAFLSSALTTTLLHLQVHAFIFSPWLLFLMSANIMLAWSVGKNMLYFRKVVYRLK